MVPTEETHDGCELDFEPHALDDDATEHVLAKLAEWEGE